MIDKTAEKQRQVLLDIAIEYCDTKQALGEGEVFDAGVMIKAVYPETLQRSIENVKRYIIVERIKIFTDIIDFWYENERKEFEYDVFDQWWQQRNERPG